MPKLKHTAHTRVYSYKLKEFTKLYQQGHSRLSIMRQLRIGKTTYYKLQQELFDSLDNMPYIQDIPRNTKYAIALHNTLAAYRNAVRQYETTKDARLKYRLLKLQGRLAISITRIRLASISNKELEAYDKFNREISQKLDAHKIGTPYPSNDKKK